MRPPTPGTATPWSGRPRRRRRRTTSRSSPRCAAPARSAICAVSGFRSRSPRQRDPRSMTIASPPAERAAASSRGAAPARWFGPSDRTPSRGLRVLAVLTAINTYAIIVMGGIVRTTGSGEGCDAPGDNGWPLCQGRLLPPWQQHAVIEFTHRWLVASMTVLLIAFSATALLRYRHRRRLVAGVLAVAVLLIIQIALGAITIQYHLSGSI